MSIVDEDVESRYVRSATTEPLTINERIATALGDRTGSYEKLIGLRICAALGADPSSATLMSAETRVSSETAAWLRKTAAVGGDEAEHATEVLSLLTSGGHS